MSRRNFFFKVPFNVIIYSLLSPRILIIIVLFIQYQIVFFTKQIVVGNSVEVLFCTLRLNLNSPYCLSYSYLNVSYENLVVHQDITVLMQPRSQSSSAISDVTSLVKLVGKIRLGRLANNGKSKMAYLPGFMGKKRPPHFVAVR